jgi:transposase
MRGESDNQVHMFSYVSAEDRIPPDHPIRAIRDLVDAVLERMSPEFDELYSDRGRRSIPPEQLLKALLLQILFTIRSERQLMEQLNYNMMYRWFVGLHMDSPVWDATVYSKNRERLLSGDIARKFFNEVLETARRNDLISQEHFTVDGTLIEAWAGQKSFKSKDDSARKGPPGGGVAPEIEDAVRKVVAAHASKGRNTPIDFKGEKRTNATHESTTDRDARLYKKGGEGAKLSFMGHAMTENRSGLVVNSRVTHATGTAERDAALAMVREIPGGHLVTLGADKGYDTADFVAELRDNWATPHVAQNDTNRRSAIDGRTTRHPGYAVSQRKRKRIEELFGWAKTVGGIRKTRHRGLERVGWMFTLVAAAYNLVRIPKLLAERALEPCPA